jgi:hypothetical protein
MPREAKPPRNWRRKLTIDSPSSTSTSSNNTTNGFGATNFTQWLSVLFKSDNGLSWNYQITQRRTKAPVKIYRRNIRKKNLDLTKGGGAKKRSITLKRWYSVINRGVFTNLRPLKKTLKKWLTKFFRYIFQINHFLSEILSGNFYTCGNFEIWICHDKVTF